jgi:DNA-binding SARP family transcriptional activator/tetratricopeptide (TPR) repeat protein
VLYRVLGTFAVGHGDEPVRLPGGHARTVLAALLIRANRPVSATELLRVAWGDTDVSKGQLEKRIGEIRTLLESIGRRDRLTTVRGLGYELQAGDDELDALRFHRLSIGADEARSAGDDDAEIPLLRAALALWQGPHIASNVDNDRLAALGRSVEERRRRMAVRLFEIEFGRRNHDRVLAEASAIAADYPTDRRLCELFMIAQWRCGDAAAANRAYVDHERVLAEELGSTPERSVRDLNYAIASGDEETIRRFEAAATPAERPVRTQTTPRQLPPPPADFVGREDCIAEAVWLLRRTQRRAPVILAVAGAGGTGKSTLALHVAHQVADSYPDGQLTAELRGSTAGAANPDEVLAGFLRALGASAVPESSADRVRAYRTLAADRSLLVVLDDAHDEEQVRDLIPGGHSCGVIITSRRRLPDIDGIHHLPTMAALESADATALFLAVLRRSRLELSPQAPGVEQVVSLCSGLPLALRVAASQYVRDHPRPLADLVDRLARHGTDAIDYGPRSLTRSIGAGLEQLDEPARRLFFGVGLSRLDEFELWTAAAVLDGTGDEPSAALAQLVAYHMVERAGEGERYRFHDLTRDYAGRQAARKILGDDQRALLERIYTAMLGMARIAHQPLTAGGFEVVHSSAPAWTPPDGAAPTDGTSAWNWYERERTNIRAAVEHCAELGLIDVCWDLAFTTHEFYAQARHFDDWHATQTIALQACQAAEHHRGEALMLVGLGQPMLVASRPASGVSGPAQLERAVALLTEAGDEHGLAIAERTLANALRRRGQLTAPLALFTRALEHYGNSGDKLGRCQTLRFLGQTYLDLGAVADALLQFTLAEAVAAEMGHPLPRAQTSYWKGQAHLTAGDHAAAEEAFRVLLEVFGAATGGTGRAYALHARGQLSLATGDLNAAANQLRESALLAGEVSDATLEGRVQLTLAVTYERLGLRQQRLAALERAVACFAGGDAVYLEATALTALADERMAAGDQAGAEGARRRVERLHIEMRLPEADRNLRP